MKIKIKRLSYEQVMALPRPKHRKPKAPNLFFRILMRLVSIPELLAARFRLTRVGMERLPHREPALILMNHSSFIDIEIVAKALFPKKFNVVSTTDSFVGKNWLMRQIGCIQTKKFIFDLGLIRDMSYALKELKSSVILFPEAGYSFDGTATPLPDTLGKCVKLLGAPLVMIKTEGAFLRQPLYNNLHHRKVDVSATMTYLLSPEEIAAMPAEEIDARIAEQFSFDHFRRQQETKLPIREPLRAESLERVLYKCPACHAEGRMRGEGTEIACDACKKRYLLDEYGFLRALEGETEFPHIPDWYAWERACVRREIEGGTYSLETDVDIYMLIDSKCLYSVGEGHLSHSAEGFHLTGCDGTLDYRQKPIASYSLNADFYWYELGDVIGIGNPHALYYCFPKDQKLPVAKARLATEELYRIVKKNR